MFQTGKEIFLQRNKSVQLRVIIITMFWLNL